MCQVVRPERSTVGQPDRKVGEDGKEAVGQGRPESEVVGDLMDGQEEILVRGGANDVGDRPELQGPEGRVSEEVGAKDLKGNDAGDDIFR